MVYDQFLLNKNIGLWSFGVGIYNECSVRVLGFLSLYAIWPYMLNIRIVPPYVVLVYIPTIILRLEGYVREVFDPPYSLGS